MNRITEITQLIKNELYLISKLTILLTLFRSISHDYYVTFGIIEKKKKVLSKLRMEKIILENGDISNTDRLLLFKLEHGEDFNDN